MLPTRSVIKFDKNACVLVNQKGLPIGTRVLGFVTHELRARQMMKVRICLCAAAALPDDVWDTFARNLRVQQVCCRDLLPLLLVASAAAEAGPPAAALSYIASMANC